MGVAGSGKSTLGQALAERLKVPFLEGDAYHPEHNRNKMTAGIPLTDEDRRPWLITLRDELKRFQETGKGCVLACSALKRSYREILDDGGTLPVRWIHLTGSRELLLRRLEQRRGHFMPPSLLESQLSTLEIPAGALTLDTALPLEEKIKRILSDLS